MRFISNKEAAGFLETLNTESKDTEPGSPATFVDTSTGRTRKKVQYEWADFMGQLLENKLKRESQDPEQLPISLPKSVPFTKSYSETSLKPSTSSSAPLHPLPTQVIESDVFDMAEALSTGNFNAFVELFLKQVPVKRSGVLVAVTRTLDPQRVPRILARLNEHMYVLEQTQKLLSSMTS